MLTRPKPGKPRVCGAPRQAQRGVVLMMALIVLVAMTLAGIALVRSVDTSNIIAGNLAFKQAATNSGDIAVESAVAWLEANNIGANLNGNIPAQGYAATANPPRALGVTWDDYWRDVLVPAGVVAVGQDVAGNTAAYAIQRMCNQALPPTTPMAGCAFSLSIIPLATSSKTGGTVQFTYTSQVMYRITARVTGPRNTVSYIQTMIAL
jgi:type IV pilus assembly protein PilX